MKTAFLQILWLNLWLMPTHGDFSSTSPQLKFLTYQLTGAMATLTTSGFGINTLPEQRLHVQGNLQLQEGNMTIASKQAGSKLHISGTISLSTEHIYSNSTLSRHSSVIVHNSANITITLPDANNYSGRWYYISGIDNTASITISDPALGIDGRPSIELQSNPYFGNPFAILCSLGDLGWTVLSSSIRE